MKRKTAFLTIMLLSACEQIPSERYADQSNPDHLIVTNSELVTITLSAKDASERLNDALSDNPPDRAVINCSPTESACKKATKALSKHHVPMETLIDANAAANITLVYDKLAAKECDNRYRDNSQNSNNLNHQAYGCSIGANIAQMVTDKRQFTKPSLMDYTDGEKAASNYDSYLNPPAASSSGGGSGGVASGIGSSLISSSSGGGGK